MRRTNRASGNDVVAVQAGQIHGRRDTDTTPKDTTPPADSTDSTGGTGGTRNTVSGNARVGFQADTVNGPIHIRM